MDPSALYFIENTHLHPTIFFPSGSGTNFHVLFFYKASNSSCIACAYFEFAKAFLAVLGMWQKDNVYVKVLIGLDKSWVET